VAAIWANNKEPETYVVRYFTKEEYLKAYVFTLEPINGPSEWPISVDGRMKAPPILRKLKSAPEQRSKEHW